MPFSEINSEPMAVILTLQRVNSAEISRIKMDRVTKSNVLCLHSLPRPLHEVGGVDAKSAGMDSSEGWWKTASRAPSPARDFPLDIALN